MRVVQHEEPERVGPLRQRTAEHHQRRRFGPDGRVVEEHQAIRYIDDYAPPTGSRELRLLAVHWAALIAFFLTTLLAGAYWGGWAALAAGLAWVLVLGRESVLILLAYGATAAVVSVLLQSFWGAVILAAPGPWSGSRASQGSRSACGGGMPTTTGGVSG
jgi:hypothetical protein